MFELNYKAIRRIMVEKGLTISDLSLSAPLTQTTVARLMRDGARANARTTGKLAAALGVDPKEIILED